MVRFFVGFTAAPPLCKRQYSVCVQEKANEPPKYFKGTCVISRNSAIYPGDGTYICMLTPIQVILIGLTVQRVYTVGEPPEDNICFFHSLENVVVLPAVGACQRVSCMPSLTNPPSSIVPCRLHGYVSAGQGASDAHNALATHTTSIMIIQV
jgi:hypothetical protein